MLELVDYINYILDINKCSEDIYPIISYMCMNNYFSNWEFKDEDIFIDGHQVTKNGIFLLKVKIITIRLQKNCLMNM